MHGLERASIGVLVAAAIFQLASGLANTAQWYPWHFHFRATHYALAWVAIGALLVHIAVKLPSSGRLSAPTSRATPSTDLRRRHGPACSAGAGSCVRRGVRSAS